MTLLAKRDQNIKDLLDLYNSNENTMLEKYNTLSNSCGKNIYLKDVLLQYKKFFEIKLQEKIAQENALMIIIEHLDTIIDTHDNTEEQSSHIEKQKDDTFRELQNIQSVIQKINRVLK
tara:strand:+ start:939 stop:1292 length:354 start_codon:yes stop_codon:yes gene_type:complete